MIKHYNSSCNGIRPLWVQAWAGNAKAKRHAPHSAPKIRNLSIMLMLLLFGLGIGKINAQSMTNYAFSTDTNGSLEDLTTGATSIMTAVEHDDDGTLIQAIGFDFYYMVLSTLILVPTQMDRCVCIHHHLQL